MDNFKQHPALLNRTRVGDYLPERFVVHLINDVARNCANETQMGTIMPITEFLDRLLELQPSKNVIILSVGSLS